jgi:transcriptional regulator with XRE-family HTH domain
VSGVLDHEDGVPVGYGDLVDTLNVLPMLIRHKRRVERLSLRAAAEASGTNFNTISRTEKGEHCSLRNAIRLLLWLDGRPEAADEDADEALDGEGES